MDAERPSEAFAAYLRMQGYEDRTVAAYIRGIEMILSELEPRPDPADVRAWLERKRSEVSSERALANVERIAKAYLAFRAEVTWQQSARARPPRPPPSPISPSRVIWYVLIGGGFVALLLSVALVKPLGCVATRMTVEELGQYKKDGSARSFVVTGTIEADRDYVRSGVIPPDGSRVQAHGRLESILFHRFGSSPSRSSVAILDSLEVLDRPLPAASEP